MLPHRSDTSRGHLHPRRVATPRPFPSRRPFFPRSSLPLSPSPGPSPERVPLSRAAAYAATFVGGRLRASQPSSPRKRPFFPLPSPLLPPQFSTSPFPSSSPFRPSFSSSVLRGGCRCTTMAIVPTRQISTRSRLFRNNLLL